MRLILAVVLTLLAWATQAAGLQLLTEENPALNFTENGQPRGLAVDVVR